MASGKSWFWGYPAFRLGSGIGASVLLASLTYPGAAMERPSDPAQAEPAPVEIAVATAATVGAIGISPQKLERSLAAGTNLVLGERIETLDTGRINILFRDGSSLTIGPNSDLAVDEFRYDAATRTGKIVLSASRGVFRYVGGRISKTTPVAFRTPLATFGIQGGINQIAISDSGESATTAHIFGISTTITRPGSDTVSINRQEYQATVQKGAGIEFGRVTPDLFADLNRSFERPAGIRTAGLPGGIRRVAAVGLPPLAGAPVVVPHLSPEASPNVPNLSNVVAALQKITSRPIDNSIIQSVRNMTTVVQQMQNVQAAGAGGGSAGIHIFGVSGGTGLGGGAIITIEFLPPVAP